MSPKGRRYSRNILVGVVLAAAAAWLAPRFLGGGHYRPRLQAALVRALGRPVRFGEISIHLFPQPGFTLKDVVVGESPEFGSEPFGKAATLSCNLRWKSLWQSRMSISSLTLEDASLNLVRDAKGQWNIEELLSRTGGVRRSTRPVDRTSVPEGLEIHVQGARLNFKIDQTTKPFAVTDVAGSIHIVPGSKSIRFKLAGSPVRTDLSYPSPGKVQFAGEWSEGGSPGGELDATLTARHTLLYDWIPLISGVNPGVYGVLDASIHVAGPVLRPQFDGRALVTQLHRWEQLPLQSPLPCNLHFRGVFNRESGQVRIASLDLAFASSQVHLAGTLSGIPAALNLDLVLGIEHSRLVDIANLYRHLTGERLRQEVAGEVDGMLTVRGALDAPRYGGFVSAREVSLLTAAGTFPVSEIDLRILGDRALLAPVRVLLAPHVEAVAEGELADLPRIGRGRPKSGVPKYELTLKADSVPLHDLLRFARGLGVEDAQNIDATGVTTMVFRLSGTAWPLSKPETSAHAAIRSARLLLPGLTEPLNIPRAAINIHGTRIIVSPLVAVMGTSVFSGRIEHKGPRREPWRFVLLANHVDIQQGSTWFDVLGKQAPSQLLQHLPGISSFLQRREAESGLLERLNAEGRFLTSSLTFEKLKLSRVALNLAVRDRRIEIERSNFVAGGGRGSGHMTIDLARQPARWSASLSLAGARLGAFAPQLPDRLKQIRGFYSASGTFRARGLNRPELLATLRGSAEVRIHEAVLGRFDLLRLLAKEAGGTLLGPPIESCVIDSAKAGFTVVDKTIRMQSGTMDLNGTRLAMSGDYRFDGMVDVTVQGNLNGVERRWSFGQGNAPGSRFAKLEFTGVIGRQAKNPAPSLPQSVR